METTLSGKTYVGLLRQAKAPGFRIHLHYLWARGYFVDTVRRDTEKIRRSIQNQEAEDRRLDQLELTDPPPQQTDRKQK